MRRRWNLWFPSAGVFAKVLAGRATGTQFVDGGRIRRNVYVKKFQRCAKALIARSDKSVAYVTDNKRLCSTFSTVEANY